MTDTPSTTDTPVLTDTPAMTDTPPAAETDDDLVHRVSVRAAADADAAPGLPAPAGDGTLAEAEARLGFPLHPLLARLYREVADGGFGPDYQLMPLLGPPDAGDDSVVGEYLARRAESAGAEHPQWPEGVVPILHWGCAMYAAVDCRSEDGQVLLFEPNAYGGGPWHDCWFADSPALATWLETWLAGTGWFEEYPNDGADGGDGADGADDGTEPTGPRPWKQAASRLAA